MKAIILAGGLGTRLHPTTAPISKQLLPVYDKPMVFYPLSTLILGGASEALIITTSQDRERFEMTLPEPAHLGVTIEYAVQQEPGGIAQALTIAQDFVGTHPTILMLGDNFFYGSGLASQIRNATARSLHGVATIFAQRVEEPQRYGIVSFDSRGIPIMLEEKPPRPQSDWAVTGLYVFPSGAAEIVETLRPSARGELEITDVNRRYLEAGKLHVHRLGRGTVWLDMGTHSDLLQASQLVEAMERRQGLKVGCLEEAALQAERATELMIATAARQMPVCDYRAYVEKLIGQNAGRRTG